MAWNPICRWSQGGRGPFEELKVTTSTITALRSLVNGRLAVGTVGAVWSGAADYYKLDLWVLAAGISNHPVAKAKLD